MARPRQRGGQLGGWQQGSEERSSRLKTGDQKEASAYGHVVLLKTTTGTLLTVFSTATSNALFRHSPS